MRKGFSLVELSIVLVILGLLTGGILAGQSLIRAAEMRSVSADIQRYQSATYSFRDKYMALPGDMTNATSFWGAAHATPATCRTTSSTTSATCNGNGDGLVDSVDSATTYSERFHFWKHLANAGLIEGNYTGVAGSGGIAHAVPGTNVPTSKMSNSGFSAGYMTTHASYYLNFETINLFYFGQTTTTSVTQGSALSTEEAWSVDTKLDDGKPAYGWVGSLNLTGNASCASSDTDASATYQLTRTGLSCQLLFKLGT